MNDTASRYPVREPAPGPCVVLDLPKLWQAVTDEMQRRGWTELKQVADATGVDRTTIGRIRRRAATGVITEGQRGGVNVNAYLTLAAFANGGVADEFGRELRGGVPGYIDSEVPAAPDASPTVGDQH
jgi:hypothetical protein